MPNRSLTLEQITSSKQRNSMLCNRRDSYQIPKSEVNKIIHFEEEFGEVEQVATEIKHDMLTDMMNEAFGSETEFLVTTVEYVNSFVIDVQYSVYFLAVDEPTHLIEFCWVFEHGDNQFTHSLSKILSFDGHVVENWSKANLDFRKSISPQIEQMLFELPTYRLRHVTGEFQNRY